MSLDLLRYFLPRYRQGNQFGFFPFIRTSVVLNLLFPKAGTVPYPLFGWVLIPAELLLHKPHSLGTYSALTATNHCGGGTSPTPARWVGFIILSAEWVFQECCWWFMFKVTPREWNCWAERQMLGSASSPSPSPSHLLWAVKIPPWAPPKGVFNACVQLPGAEGTVSPWQGVMVSLGESLWFLSKHPGQGQHQHETLQGMIVLKAEICLATNPTYQVGMSLSSTPGLKMNLKLTTLEKSQKIKRKLKRQIGNQQGKIIPPDSCR